MMKVNKRQILNTAIYARNIREQIISSSFIINSNFFCIKCQRLHPFGGDMAIQFYGNPGVTLFCNNCLAQFEENLQQELERSFNPS